MMLVALCDRFVDPGVMLTEEQAAELRAVLNSRDVPAVVATRACRGPVYIAALAPDADETSQSQQEKFPVTDVFGYVEPAGGRLWMRPAGVECFAGDLSEEEKSVVWATHYAPAVDLFSHNAPGVAWRTKTSWYVVASEDRTVQPDLERFVAKRMTPRPTRSGPVTSRCCPSPTSCST